jgi:hypothetical protein
VRVVRESLWRECKICKEESQFGFTRRETSSVSLSLIYSVSLFTSLFMYLSIRVLMDVSSHPSHHHSSQSSASVPYLSGPKSSVVGFVVGY